MASGYCTREYKQQIEIGKVTAPEPSRMEFLLYWVLEEVGRSVLALLHPWGRHYSYTPISRSLNCPRTWRIMIPHSLGVKCGHLSGPGQQNMSRKNVYPGPSTRSPRSALQCIFPAEANPNTLCWGPCQRWRGTSLHLSHWLMTALKKALLQNTGSVAWMISEYFCLKELMFGGYHPGII